MHQPPEPVVEAQACKYPGKERYYLRVECPLCEQRHYHWAGASFDQLIYFDGQRYAIPCCEEAMYRLTLIRQPKPTENPQEASDMREQQSA